MSDPCEAGAHFRVETLTEAQVREIYRARMTRDFPPDELKPLATILNMLRRGQYICYGAVAEGRILAYAYLVLLDGCGLVDYLAVDAALRDRGIGSRFLQALIGASLRDKGCLLLEVDDPDAADTDAERALRLCRLRFYLRNGLTDTGVRAVVYGVAFRVLRLPLGGEVSAEEVRGMYARLYRAMLPGRLYETMVQV